MKSLNTITFLSLLSLGFLGVTRSYAEENTQEAGHEMIKNLHDVSTINQEVKAAGTLPAKCPGCAEKEPDLKVTLDKKSVDLGRPFYRRDNEPYVVFIKRTSETPAKVDLPFKNNYRTCAKTYFGSNPYNGSIIIDCLMYMTQYVDEEISLNLKNLPKLKAGEEDLIEVKFYKSDINSDKYRIEVKHFGEPSSKEEIDKKFWGSGYNVGFKESQKK